MDNNDNDDDFEIESSASDTVAAFERFTNADSTHRLKRRFPGPAGLLPTVSSKHLKLLNHAPHPLSQQFSKIIDEYSVKADKEVVTLQGITPGLESRSENEPCFRKAPWKEILKELNIDMSNNKCPIHFMNIKWIRTKAHKLTFFKIPFLLVVLQEAPEITVGTGKIRAKNPSVKLIDTTGSIVAAMDAEVISSFGDQLFPGTAIALRNIGLLRLTRQVILTITRKNILCIASYVNANKNANDSRDSRDTTLIHFSNCQNENNSLVKVTDENVKITTFSQFDAEIVMKEYEEITRLKTNSPEEKQGREGRSAGSTTGLFTSINNVQNSTSNIITRGSTSVNDSAMNDMSAFDDDDDELFQALDNIDFGNDFSECDKEKSMMRETEKANTGANSDNKYECENTSNESLASSTNTCNVENDSNNDVIEVKPTPIPAVDDMSAFDDDDDELFKAVDNIDFESDIF